MKELNELLGAISGFLWGWPMIVLLLGTHLFLTVRLRFPQRHIFKAIRLSVQKDVCTRKGAWKEVVRGSFRHLYRSRFIRHRKHGAGVSAFNPEAAGGGFVGAGIMMAARYGIARGLFSNESGLGSAPIVAAAAKTKNPVRQALVSSTGTFWDTVVICAITGIVIVSSILAFPDISFENGGELTTKAFSKIPYIGAPLLAFGSLTFAFSTILGWSYYGERAVEYMAGKTRLKKRFGIKPIINIYRVIFLITVYLGAVVSLDLVWNLADIFNALMAIPNLISLIFLSGVIVKETRQYLWQK